MVAVYLFFEVLFTFGEVSQSTVHAFHLLLALKPFTMFTPNISGDRV